MTIDRETIGTDTFRRFGWGEAMLWSGAFIAVLTAGVSGTFLATTWRQEPELPGAPPAAIMIELAPISMSSQVENIAADPIEQHTPEPVVEPIVEPEIEPEPIEDIQPEDIIEEIAEQLEPDPEPVEDPEPEPVVDPEPIDELAPVDQSEPVEEVVPDLVESDIAEVTMPLPIMMPASIARQRAEFAEARERERLERERIRAQQQQQTVPRSVEAQQNTQTAAPQQTNTTRMTPSNTPDVVNYPGEIIARLRRALRYPSAARGASGQAVVTFTVSASGAVTSIGLVSSSGNASLDQAAIDTVRRAAPFPPIPAAANRSSWPFTLPLAFVR